ncbi:unnamed protein product [Cuscuta campestris]|uniref:Reverse transcriptase domain-containing protein n=2 Tax=Cuscuta campestris TaxID=132261 RepID=A0A484MQA4_9ASTE|nr:unnamed protein product [Cuscuta campestris]
MWLKHDRFQDLVSHSWQPEVNGTKQVSLCSKLKRLKPSLKSLNKHVFSHISNRALEAKEDYSKIMKDLMNDPNNQTLLDLAEAKRKQANFLLDAELEFYQQKAKCDFLMKSDRCTSYFHSLVKKNRRKNAIPFLIKEDGAKTISSDEVASCFLEYYTGLFGNTSPTETINVAILETGNLVPLSAHSALLATVTIEEVKEVVFDIGNDKAPGPDGYTAAFFKNQWETVGQDVFGAILEFFTTSKLLKQLNHAMIVLIPKTTHNPTVKDFRPISCLNVLYKVITKILARRMAPLLPQLIDPAQGAFVQGRSLVDNLLLAQHLIRDYAIKRSTPSCMIKLDISKAYDTVSWSFLEEVMLGLGFPVTFISFVMECVTSVSSSIMVNGEDDIMLFSRADFHSVHILMHSLEHFSSVSGLTLNPTKSNIFIAGRLRDASQDILDLAPFPRGHLPWQPKKRYSVLFKRLACVRELLVQKLGSHNSSMEVAMQIVCEGDNLVPSKVYDLLRVKANPKPWMAFIWHSTIPPKCSFTMWLVFRRRLPTKSNLEFLGLPMECTLCGDTLEDIDHLFFGCVISKQVWEAIKQWLRIDGHLSTLDRAVRWMKTFRRGDAVLKKARRIGLACTVFQIWKQRNATLFDQEPIHVEGMIFKIKVMVYSILGRLWHTYSLIF